MNYKCDKGTKNATNELKYDKWTDKCDEGSKNTTNELKNQQTNENDVEWITKYKNEIKITTNLVKDEKL